MLKILQARLLQYMNHEVPDVQAGSSAYSKTSFEHQEVYGSHIAEAWLGEF